jgi:hypothetical protein
MTTTRREFLTFAPAVLLAQAPQRTPVLVELFTSEGCSSCPPADEFLRRLVEENSVPGVDIIALGQHVDYWNRLGWKDPFSDKKFSARQQWYANKLRIESSYTPQMIIDGSWEFVGSNTRLALKTIAQSAQNEKSPVHLEWKNDLHTAIDPIPNAGKTEVVLAIAENNLTTDIRSGENRGRRVTHNAVVRSWRTIGKMEAGAAFSMKIPVPIENTWKQADVRAVVFAQDLVTARILAVGSVGQ